MLMPCYEDLVVSCKWSKEWKKAEQVISIAVQTDVSIAKPVEFVEEQTKSPLLSKMRQKVLLNVVCHTIYSAPGATQSDWSQLGLEGSCESNKWQILI